jgi:hypothetical protein
MIFAPCADFHGIGASRQTSQKTGGIEPPVLPTKRGGGWGCATDLASQPCPDSNAAAVHYCSVSDLSGAATGQDKSGSPSCAWLNTGLSPSKISSLAYRSFIVLRA